MILATPVFWRRTVGAAFAALVLAASPAASDGKQRPTAAERNACLADFSRLCPGVQPGGGRVQACFETHFQELSRLCRQAVESARQKRG